ncbi:MAG: transposase [Ilumatobacteraceae bacterium]
MCEWAAEFDDRAWAIESANRLGDLVAQQLVAACEVVFDVAPVLAARVRVLGTGRSQKNDPNDARSFAIAALRSDRLAQVRPDDHARVLRLVVKRHRGLARLRAKHCTRLHALLLELAAGGIASEMTVTKARGLLKQVHADDEAARLRVLIATELIDDIAQFDATIKASKKRVAAPEGTSRAAPESGLPTHDPLPHSRLDPAPKPPMAHALRRPIIRAKNPGAGDRVTHPVS